MLKKEFIESIASKTGETNANTEKMVNAVFETIGEIIKADDSIQINGFGTFKRKVNAARNGINPATKQPIKIAESKGVSFKVASKLKEELNK